MLCWNVFVEDVNAGRITQYNIFTHGGFLRDCREALKVYPIDRDGFAAEVKHALMYFFWSKCEYETVLSGWPPSERTESRKIDVYSQVCLNFEAFVDYLWSHRPELSSWPEARFV